MFEALPVDDPQVRQPDITRARQLLGWEPEIALDDGLRRTLASLGRDTGACVESARCSSPSPSVSRVVPGAHRGGVAVRCRLGIFDDGLVLYGEPELDVPAARDARGRSSSA